VRLPRRDPFFATWLRDDLPDFTPLVVLFAFAFLPIAGFLGAACRRCFA